MMIHRDGVPRAVGAGLRDRKKERTRDRLAAAARDLVIERGYDATTVDDIAAAVDVSPRTLFRYFATKDEAIAETLRTHGKLTVLTEAFAARPGDEPLVASLRAAAHALADAISQERGKVLLLERVLRAAPTLRARLLDQKCRQQAELTCLIACRLGAEPTDIRARMIAALSVEAIVTAVSRWAADGAECDLRGLVDDGLDLLEPGTVRAVAALASGRSGHG